MCLFDPSVGPCEVLLATTARLPGSTDDSFDFDSGKTLSAMHSFFFFLSVSVPIHCRIDMTSNKVNWSDMDLNSHIFRHSVYPGAVCPLQIHLKMVNIIHDLVQNSSNNVLTDDRIIKVFFHDFIQNVHLMQKLSNTQKS